MQVGDHVYINQGIGMGQIAQIIGTETSLNAASARLLVTLKGGYSAYIYASNDHLPSSYWLEVARVHCRTVEDRFKDNREITLCLSEETGMAYIQVIPDGRLEMKPDDLLAVLRMAADNLEEMIGEKTQ